MSILSRPDKPQASTIIFVIQPSYFQHDILAENYLRSVALATMLAHGWCRAIEYSFNSLGPDDIGNSGTAVIGM
jgi:hypothetical protein